jgi:dolichol-phosphate mannosyltransferase
VAHRESIMDLTIIIPTLNEAGNIGELITRARGVLDPLGVAYEILIMDGGSTDQTREEAAAAGARPVLHEDVGYGAALRQGFREAQGAYIITMDSDLSHEPEFIATLWKARDSADILIASRYAAGGSADMPRFRRVLSVILNLVFTTVLWIPVRDISSGFRLYRRTAIQSIECRARNFDVLEEILIKLYLAGHAVAEVPFNYRPRKEGKSHAKLFKFGVAYLRTLSRMMRLRWGGK